MLLDELEKCEKMSFDEFALFYISDSDDRELIKKKHKQDIEERVDKLAQKKKRSFSPLTKTSTSLRC